MSTNWADARDESQQNHDWPSSRRILAEALMQDGDREIAKRDQRIAALEQERAELWAFVADVDTYMEEIHNTANVSMETRLLSAKRMLKARAALTKYEEAGRE